MKKSVKQLFWWSILIYMVLGPIQRFANSFDFVESFSFLFNFKATFVMSTSIPVFFGMALGTYVILHKYYTSQKLPIVLSLIIANSLVFISLRYLLQEKISLALMGFTNYYNDPTLMYYYFDNIYYGFIFSSIGAVLYFVKYSMASQDRLKNMEVDKRNMELSMLRSQINPHFLFNQLNSIYSLVYQKSESALPAISSLSDFLRYSLYEKKHQVPLADELNSIRNFIDLQKIRMGDSSFIELDIPQEEQAINIHPYIFLPFVENAIKHGRLDDPDNPVKIGLAINNNTLHFSTDNLKSTAQKDKSGGIGLDSIKRRLALLYKDQYTLNIEDLTDRYQVGLTINILP